MNAFTARWVLSGAGYLISVPIFLANVSAMGSPDGNVEMSADCQSFRVVIRDKEKRLDYNLNDFAPGPGKLAPWAASVFIWLKSGERILGSDGRASYKSSSLWSGLDLSSSSYTEAERNTNVYSPWYPVECLFAGIDLWSKDSNIDGWEKFIIEFEIQTTHPDGLILALSDPISFSPVIRDYLNRLSRAKAAEPLLPKPPSTAVTRAAPANKMVDLRLPPGFGNNAELVIYAEVIDPDTGVRAGSHQHFVWSGQQWRAIKVEVKRVTKGALGQPIVWLVNLASPTLTTVGPNNSFVTGRWHWECQKGAFYAFALIRDPELSKWCEFDVFDIRGTFPDTYRPVSSSIPIWDGGGKRGN